MGSSPLRQARNIGVLATIPMVLVVGPFVGFYFGSFVDRWFHSDPWGKIVLSILGFAAGIKQTIKIIRDATAQSETPDNRPPGKK